MSESNNEFNFRDGVSLKEHFNSRLLDLEKATTRTAAQLEKRFEGVNEFRAALKDQASTMATRQEVDERIHRVNTDLHAIREDIKILREYKAAMDSKASQWQVNLAYVISVVGVLVSVYLQMAK